jgi:putative ABC transport system permease protein
VLALKLAWMQTLSLWRAGALRVLVFALVLAIAAITAVGFFTQRVDSALNQQGGLLLGGDIALKADHALDDAYIDKARSLGLDVTQTYEFPSMVIHQEANQLAEIKAVGQSFPLRGDLSISVGNGKIDAVKHGPKPGEAWVEPRLANLLNIKVGSQVEVGEKAFLVTAILEQEPSRGGDMFGFAPRVMLHADDLAATGLIQFGSRVKYQLLFAGTPTAIAKYQRDVVVDLKRGEKLEDVKNARPEIKSALDKAQQFLGLSAMVSVMLAMMAMLLSSMPYIKQSLDSFALMRCFGAKARILMQVLSLQTGLIAFFSALIGIVIGYFVQLGLAELAGSLFLETLPQVSILPALVGLVASLFMMFAVVIPHAWHMRGMSAMNILRRDTLGSSLADGAQYLPAVAVMIGMVFWQAQDVKIATSTLLAVLALSVLVALVAYVLVKLGTNILQITPLQPLTNAAKIGLHNIKRRFGLSVIQMLGFSVGLMVLMLLALVQGDLIRNWQASLPEDAPNQFVINIQTPQITPIKTLLSEANVAEASVFPMVRGRLVRVNHQALNIANFTDERAKRLAEREFNLSWAETMQSDNTLTAGRWWTEKEHDKPYISMEQDLANTLNIKLNDVLTFDIAGNTLDLTVTSLRKVDWDTMRANFFAVTPPGVLAEFSASYISSFHLPPTANERLNKLVKTYPNLTVIDIAAFMQQVRGIMQKMSSTIQYVFIFSLLAGVAVLYAALVATQQERITEATLMRVFGASHAQVAMSYFAEFAMIGAIAAVVAAVAANALAYYLSVKLFNIPFQFNVGLSLSIILISALLIPLSAWLGLRQFLNIPPRQLLNSV